MKLYQLKGATGGGTEFALTRICEVSYLTIKYVWKLPFFKELAYKHFTKKS